MNEIDVLVLKKNIIKAKNEDYKYIIITYEGSGDDGSVEQIYMSNEIPDSPWESINGQEITLPDSNAIENWACDTALESVSNWYDYDGGYGIIVINVNDGTYEVENNVRYVDVTTETQSGKV